MAPSEFRPRINATTIPSRPVTANALRLVLGGYLAKLVYNQGDDGNLYWSIPSETRTGVVYQIDFDPAHRTLSCSCPAGMHGRPCKHLRLFQLMHGMAIGEVTS